MPVIDHLDAAGTDQITVEHAVAWATLPGGGEHWHSMRLGAVRGFARYLHEVDPRVEVPPADVLPDRSRRAVPYLYTDEQILGLMRATSTLRTSHKAATFRTLFGLLLVAGMRIGEVIALDRTDFDADLGTLIIRHGKFGKSRELPLHPSTTSAVTRYTYPTRGSRQDVLVSGGRARADGARRRASGPAPRSRAMSALAISLQAWFTDRLIRERNASPHTIASYRDTIRLLLTYASQRLGVEPSRFDLGQLDAPLIGAFLDHLETDRGCGARTRNTRLAAIRTFYRYCMSRHPEHAAIERVLQIGPKRHERALVTYLTEPELDALIDAPDRSSWTGRRDHAIITLLAQTGLRASELTGLRCGDVHLGPGAHATTTGKGRKQRITPLTKQTAALLRVWLAERGGSPADPLFPTSTGKPLTRKALARRIAKHATLAARRCPSLTAKTITPHVYADPVVKPTLARCRRSGQLGLRDCRHIQRSSRNPRSVSGGR